MGTESNNKQIVRNTMFLYIRMFFTLIVSLYTSRVVLQNLGVIDYGVYNTVAGFVTMFAFLNSTLSTSMQRFYNFEGARCGVEGYRKVYSTGIVIHFIVMLIILILLETLGIWYLNNIMVLPVERLLSAKIVFQTSVISLCLLIISIPYSGSIIAAERMDYYALVSILEIFLKLIFVLLLPHLSYDKLIVYGILMLLSSVVNFLLYFFYAKKNILNFSLTFTYDRAFLKQLLSFSSWNVVGTFIFALKGQALNMLLNFFFGPIVNAARGIAFQVGNAISSFSANISLAFRPQMVTSYSQNDTGRVLFLFSMQSKICFALIAILITPVILNIDYILRIWLGTNVPQYTSIFVCLVLLDALICTLNTPCTQVVSATGKIKGYQIASSLVNVLLLPVSWLFLKLGFEPISTFIITVVFSVLNQGVCVWQMLKVFDIKISQYLTSIIIPCIIYITICPLIGYIFYHILEPSFLRLCLITLVSGIWGVFLTYYVLMNRSERRQVMSLIKQKLNR